MSTDIDIRRAALIAHPIYAQLTTTEHLCVFMKHHVFAVWDFFSLLKRLQVELTTVTLPWRPAGYAQHARFITEIVLAEETDELIGGGWSSHFELYLAAMHEMDADTGPIEAFLGELDRGVDPFTALEHRAVPDGVRPFVGHTLGLALHGELHEVAASFCHGRENLLPDVFSAVRAHGSDVLADAPTFRHYIDRHIALDHDEHGPLALRLLSDLCAGDPRRLAEADRAGLAAIQARIGLWDGVIADMKAEVGAGQ